MLAAGVAGANNNFAEIDPDVQISLSYDKAETMNIAFSTDAGSVTATSNNVVVSPAAAGKLVFTVEPSNTLAGASITPPVQVSVEDANGNVVTSDTSNVTIALSTNPGSGTLGGTVTVAAANGLATFSNLSIDAAGTGYTLAADDGNLTGTTSIAFNITVASSSLSGYVYLDATNSGKRMISSGVYHVGIPNVTVTLERTDALAPNQTALTQIDGSYHFDSLPAGTYTLVETQPQEYLHGTDTAIGYLSKRLALASMPTAAAIVVSLDPPPVAIASPSATITYAGGSDLASLAVTIANLEDGNSENFVVASQTIVASTVAQPLTSFPKITAAYAAGVLTLTGVDSVGDYQSVLRSIQYEDMANPADTSPRYITVVANDAIAASNTVTTTVTDPPASAAANQFQASAVPATPSSLAATPVAGTLNSAKLADQVLGSVNNWLGQ